METQQKDLESILKRAREGYRTPRIDFNSEKRIEIKLCEMDTRRLPGRGVFAYENQAKEGVLVTDLLTGKKYRWFLAACGSPTCFCDAVVLEVR